MSRSARWLFLAAMLPVAACSSNNSAPPVAAAPPAPPPLAAADQAFLNAAASSDAVELQTSQLAATKARSKAVKDYAAHMISDHTKVDQQLMTLAQSKGATPDATPPQMAQDLLAKLNADRPAQFDRDYMHGQYLAHQMTVKAFQDEIANGQDADIKQFATTNLPLMQQHLALARRLGGARG